MTGAVWYLLEPWEEKAMRGWLVVAAVACACSAVLADFKVGESEDVIVLKDDTELRGVVIASGLKAVVIVIQGENGPEERIIVKEDIKDMALGKPSGRTKACTTDPQDGLKVVTGEGFRETKPAPKKQSGGKPAAQAKAPQAKQKPAPKQAAKPAQGKVTPDMIKVLMQQNPQLKTFVNRVGGPEKAAALISDPNQRKQLEEMARKFNIQIPKSF